MQRVDRYARAPQPHLRGKSDRSAGLQLFTRGGLAHHEARLAITQELAYQRVRAPLEQLDTEPSS